MSKLEQARPTGYDRAARKARRHAESMESKQDHNTHGFQDQFDRSNKTSGAGTVPGYYLPKDSKYFISHPRERDWVDLRSNDRTLDTETNPAAVAYKGFKRDLEKGDIKRWEDRRKIQHQIKYDEWLTRRFNVTDPHVARWLRRIEPEFWERRHEFLKDKMDIQAFLTRIRLYGPQSLEDFEGLYALHKDANLADGWERPNEATGTVGPVLKYREGRFAMGANMRSGSSRRYRRDPIEADSKAYQY